MLGDEAETSAAFEEFGAVELVFELGDVGQEKALVFVSPAVVDLHAFVLINEEGIIEEGHFGVVFWVLHASADVGFVVAVADGLHQFGFEFGFAHRVLVL
jgi:hypothetical protein